MYINPQDQDTQIGRLVTGQLDVLSLSAHLWRVSRAVATRRRDAAIKIKFSCWTPKAHVYFETVCLIAVQGYPRPLTLILLHIMWPSICDQ